MSFDKTYPNRKDWRKHYRGAKSIAKSCRVHGRCSFCRGNRLYSAIKSVAAAKDELKHDWPLEFAKPLAGAPSWQRLF